MKVYLEPLYEYDTERIANIIDAGITYCGINIPKKSTVLIKPNILGIYSPEQHITTHPAVIEAVIRILLDNGNNIIIGDSSGVVAKGGTRKALTKSGILGLKNRYDKVIIRPFEEVPLKKYENIDNYFLKEANITGLLDEVEAIVNIPKLKSHQLTKYTGAVKNLFGCIPGGAKQQAHITAPGADDFSHLLLDLYSFIKPKITFNVIDAIKGIEGEGPGPAGNIIEIGFIGVSQDAVALDMAATEIIQVDAKKIYTIHFALERKLTSGIIEKNTDIEPVRFKMPFSIPFERFFYKHFSGLSRQKPELIKEKCKRCGFCVKVCPAGAITMQDFPIWNYDKCFYCYCCHENCPHTAIKFKSPFIYKIFSAFNK